MYNGLYEDVRRNNPAAVIATKWMPEGPAYLLARRRVTANMFLLGYGREFMPERGRPLRAYLQRRVLSAATLCMSISDYTADNFLRSGVPEERVRMIGAGVSPDSLISTADAGHALRDRLGLPDDAFLVLTVARLVRRKGHDLVLRALADLAPSNPDLRYAIIGDGPERAVLESMAEGLGLKDRVLFAGPVPDADLPAWYAACDALVMPSRDVPGQPPEGFGLVYLEAGAAGKPVIGARTGGVPSAIVHGQTGLLVEPEDVGGLTEALRTLMSDRAAAAAMGEQGRDRVLADFTWDHVAARFLTYLTDAL
jgi:phosphatidylinositol alpha-1,6-mannosyltransferase